MNQDDIKSFLSHLAVEQSVAIATQKQAFDAILFLFRHIQSIRKYYKEDQYENRPGVELPKALERKYPNAGKEWE